MARNSKNESHGRLQNWDDLRFFLAVARNSALARAARELGVEVSTVHRRIASLESALNVELFQRHSTGHRLTDQGKELFELAEKANGEVLSFERAANRDTGYQIITISATDDLITFLAPVLADYGDVKPQIRVRLLASEGIVNLTKREADIAIRFAQTSHKELVVKELCPLAFALYAAPKYIEKNGELKTLKLLSKHCFVGAEGELANAPALKWLIERISPYQVVCTTNSVACTPSSLIRAAPLSRAA